MRLIFLGTSAGTPSKTRNVTALALAKPQSRSWFLFDCGEATQHQLLHSHLSVNDLAAVFISHVHGDHCYGLPGLLALAAIQGRKHPLQIIAPQAIEAWLQATQLHTSFTPPFAIIFTAIEKYPSLTVEDFAVEVTPLSHRVPSYAFQLTLAERPTLDVAKLHAANIPQGKLWGKLQQGIDITLEGTIFYSHEFIMPRQQRRIVICGDNDKPHLLQAACAHCDVLVHEATFTKDLAVQLLTQVGHCWGHSYAEQVAEFAEQQHIPNLILTHFSPRYHAPQSMANGAIYQEAKRCYKGNLYLANDFDHYIVQKSGELIKA